MASLSNQHCEVCRTGAPLITEDEATELLTTLPLWRKEIHSGVEKLIREYQFKDFVSAIEFTNRIGELAEQEQHHPSILTQWGEVTLYWWTHKINGLHLNDFIMASKSDLLADQCSES
jgi:4a-hydroxytetrahydrobiopterin dehydratase